MWTIWIKRNWRSFDDTGKSLAQLLYLFIGHFLIGLGVGVSQIVLHRGVYQTA